MQGLFRRVRGLGAACDLQARGRGARRALSVGTGGVQAGHWMGARGQGSDTKGAMVWAGLRACMSVMYVRMIQEVLWCGLGCACA